MLRSMLLTVALAALVPLPAGADGGPAPAIEQQIADVVGSAKVTVVHLWAPWCSDCRVELAGGAWSEFIGRNPDVNFVFVTVWNPADGRSVLEKNGVGEQKNFQLLLHPNGSRRRGEMMTELMGLPVSWIPTTWIFREGKLRYALNYGRLRFPMLQQLIKDSSDTWEN